MYVHGKYVYSTLALGKEREIVKEETALRKEKEAVCYYVYMYMYMYTYKLYKDAYNCIYMYMYMYIKTPTGSRNGLEKRMHIQTDIKSIEIKMHTGCPALRTGNGGFKICYGHVHTHILLL